VTSQQGDQEGIPLVLHEAMASGLPIISTRHTGIPELVDDGENGFLVSERDPQAIADRLTYLVEHPETWYEMGQRGRKHIEEHNHIEKQTDLLVELYRLLLEKPFGLRKGQEASFFGRLAVAKVKATRPDGTPNQATLGKS
jgi:colanic acid/amylovoran/stewartan biosynthesis glycosyltransferase WcaL/AmsK/CpsK